MNQLRGCRIALDLLAEAKNVNIYGAIRNGAILSPNRVQQLLAAENHARTAHQKFEQPELGRGERQRRIVEPHLAARAVQLQRARLQHAGRRRLRTELQLDSRDQFANKEWLHDIVVRAQLETDN